MDWGIVSTTVAVILGVIAIFLSIKLIKKKQPAWAHKTVEIIDLGVDAPPELQLLYEGRSVRGVYRTTAILFNSGSEVIDSEDVTVPMTVHFVDGEILSEPKINARSNDENKVTVVKEEGDIVANFSYLGHNDGIVFEVIHTAVQMIDFNVNVKGVSGSKNLGEFDDFPKGVISKSHIMVLILGTLGTALLVWFIVTNPTTWNKFTMDIVAAVTLILTFTGLGAFGAAIPQYIRSKRFPRWSRGTISKTSVLVSQVMAFCVSCRKKQAMNKPQQITMKNGKYAVQGVCPVCNTKMFRIGSFYDIVGSR